MKRAPTAWTVISLAFAAALAALDLVLGSAPFITALVAPLFVAAARAGRQGTALVAVVCVALAIALGAANDVFAEPAQVVRCAVVAASGLLAMWVAGLADSLARSHDEMRAILEGVADAVVARSADGDTVFANRAALNLLGFDTEAQMLEHPEPLIHNLEVLAEDGRPLGAAELPGSRAAAGHHPAPVTVQLRSRETGEERWAVVKATPIVGASGRPAMSITLVEDVTETKLAERRQRLLAESGRLLTSSLNYEATMRAVAEIAVPGFADWCSVEVLDAGGVSRQVGLAAADPSQLPLARRLRERYPPDPDAPEGTSRAMRTGESQLIAHIPDALLEEAARDPEHLRMLRALDVRSTMVVPMVARGRTLGVVSFLISSPRPAFDEQALALAQELAARMATALDNARLYRERSAIARALQESLLPPALPEVPGMDVAARFRAAGEGVEVGGDFYDLFDLQEGTWGVVIGDVCGKGPRAAAVTAQARYTLRAAAMRDSSPSAALAALNEAMVRQRQDDQFCTVAMARLEPREGAARVSVASGGHPLPLLLRADGQVTRAGHAGTLLGVVDDPQLGEEEVEMEPGDALVFYTDGVTEAQAPERILSHAQLSRQLSACTGCDAATLAETIERHAVPSDREPRDDVAILVLKLREI